MLKTLLKLNFYAFFASFGGKRDKNGTVKKRSSASITLYCLLLVFCAVTFMSLFAGMFFTLGSAFAGSEYSWLYFSLMAIMVFLIDFIMTIFTAKSQLFEAKDNETLLALPIRPRDILISRMMLILLTDYLFEIIIALPAICVWFFLGSASPLGVVCFLVMLVFMPLLALSCACFVAWLLSLVSSRMKNSAYLNTVLSLVLFALYMLFVMRMENYVQAIVANGAPIASAVKKYFYPFYCFGNAAANGNLLSCLLYILCMILPFALVCFILARSFISLVTRQRGGKQAVYREKKLKAKSLSSTLLAREFAHLGSSSVYMLNAGISLVFVLAMAVAVFFIPLEQFIEPLGLSPDTVENLFPAIAIGLIVFFSSMSMFTAPSVSLEGQSITLMQSLPVSGRKVLLAKLYMHLLIVLPVTLIASVCCAIALPCTPLMGVLLIAVPALFNVFMALFGLCMNLAMPRFDWTNETVIVKQSGAVTVTMFGGMLAAIFLTVIAVILSVFLLPVPAAVALVTLPVLAADIALWCYLNRNGDRVFAELG